MKLKNVDPKLVAENELPKTGKRYEDMLNNSGLKVQMKDILESYDEQTQSLEESTKYFNSIEEETGITCGLIKKGTEKGITTMIPYKLPSRGIESIMNFYNIPNEISDIVVKGYKKIYVKNDNPEYDLKINFGGKNYIFSLSDIVDLNVVISKEEKEKWTDYIKNKIIQLDFFEDESGYLHDIHENEGPYGGGKIYYTDPSYESYSSFVKSLKFSEYDTDFINEEQYKKGILVIVPYRTYYGNHDCRYSFIIPVDNDISKKIKRHK